MKTIARKGFSPMEVAKMLGVSLATIYREMDRGRLGSVKVGTRRVITQVDLEAYMGKERAKALLLEDDSSARVAELAEQERLARIDAAMGMFAHLPGSVDDFIREKQEEIKLEERRDRSPSKASPASPDPR